MSFPYTAKSAAIQHRPCPTDPTALRFRRISSEEGGRVKKLLVLLNAFILIACSTSNLPEREGRSDRPNILLAIADDWSWPHAGFYGDEVVRTPTFNRLASEGIVFDHAYVSSPSCTPSRAAILTGQWHWRLEESANLWSTLDRRFPVYPDLLEMAGYLVGFTRKGWGPGRIEPGGRTRNPAGDRYESFSEFLDQREEEQPFCFWFGTTDPHRPYEKGSGRSSGIDPSEISVPPFMPDAGPVRNDIADYYYEVERFDRELGELLEELARRGELENTIVVVTSDNGMPFPRAKATLYDAGTRVPLIVWWPDRFPGERRIDDFVSLTDLAPTLLELAGQDVPAEMTGKSLAGILTATPEDQQDRSFVLTGKERHVPCQEAPESGGTPMRAIRTREFLYIHNFAPDRWPGGTPDYEDAFLPGSWYGDIDNGPSKTYMVEHRDQEDVQPLYELAFEKRPSEELYDLGSDPWQMTNVAQDPNYRETKEKLHRMLMEKLRASEDPRVLGEGERFDDFPYYGGTPLAPEYEPQGQ